VESPHEARPALQNLQSFNLTRLVDLRLGTLWPYFTISVTASMLSGLNLSRLELSGFQSGPYLEVEPDVLSGRTLLQHLAMRRCSMVGAAAGEAHVLSYVQRLQQLTHLSLTDSLQTVGEAAAYSALTASSKLQHLNLTRCKLPAHVWQHIFPTGRQLPHLQLLRIAFVQQPSGTAAPAPEGSRLVSSCPGLRSLDMSSLTSSSQLLAPLQGLSELHTLHLVAADVTSACVGTVCQLTRLRQLKLQCSALQGQVLQLAQLRQLTWLICNRGMGRRAVVMTCEVGEASQALACAHSRLQVLQGPVVLGSVLQCVWFVLVELHAANPMAVQCKIEMWCAACSADATAVTRPC
jgi:hypothetical protein